VKLLFGQNEYVAGVVGDGLGVMFSGPYVAIGFLDDSGAVKGGAVFNNYNGSNIEVTVYAPRMAARGLIRAVLHYCFVQLGCNRLTARTRRNNKLAQKSLLRMGFAFEASLPLYYGPNKNDAAILYRMDRKTALKRWLNG
jgi:RimJ/RimL family protein N-acetyltransferase